MLYPITLLTYLYTGSRIQSWLCWLMELIMRRPKNQRWMMLSVS